ncbi:MAG: DUF6079 family protein [Acidobacteriota bacterium]|nr:response regulator [Blastocatellia bacterium]MDW8411141.1 DUF6079 family protein [Acidobacteriota bacterium]
MTSQQIKAFVGLRQIDQVTRFEVVSDEQIVKAFRFTEQLATVVANVLTMVSSGRGAVAIVGKRGVGKSHVLSLVRSIASQPFLVNLLQETRLTEPIKKIAQSRISNEGISTLSVGFDPEKGLNFVKAFPRLLGLEGELPSRFSVDQLDDIIERRVARSETFSIFVDGVSSLMGTRPVGDRLAEWLMYLVQKAEQGRFALVVTLNEDLLLPQAPYAQQLSSLRQQVISLSNYVQLIAEHICCKSEEQFRALENMYDDLRGRMPHFTGSREEFVWLYPLHPIVLELAPAMRRYSKSFSLLGFITGVVPRALVRRAMSLVCLDDLFESFEFDIRKNPELAPIFAAYDRIFGTVIPRLGQFSLYGKMMLKSLLLLSLRGRPVTAMDIADGMMIYDDRDPEGLAKLLENICRSIADGSGGEIICETINGRLSYIFRMLRIAVPEPPSEEAFRLEFEEETTSETQLLMALKARAEQIPDTEERLYELLIDAGKNHFKDWPFVYDAEGKFKQRTEINLKWAGSLRRGILKFGGDCELDRFGVSAGRGTVEYDWQVILHPPGTLGMLPPSIDLPSTLLYWVGAELDRSELMVLKHLLVMKTEGKRLLAEEQYTRIVGMLESEVADLFCKVYLEQGALLANQWSSKRIPYQISSFLGSVLSRLLDEPLTIRYPCHPDFEELLDQEGVDILLGWMFRSEEKPTQDQIMYLSFFAIPLELVKTEGEEYILNVDREFPEGSPVRVIQKALETLGEKPLSKQSAYAMVRSEPYGLQMPALLLILGALAAARQVVLTDEVGGHICDERGIAPGKRISDFVHVYSAAARLEVSWKGGPKKKAVTTADYHDHTLLIVDDDPGMQAIVQLAVKQLGCKVLTAKDGLSALQMLKTQKVDLVLSDMRMPNMTGVELFAKMQEEPALVNVPFIVMSSIDDDEEIANALESGVEDYWIKPLSVQEIIARVRKVFRKRRTGKTGLLAEAAIPELGQLGDVASEKATSEAASGEKVDVSGTRYATQRINKRQQQEVIEVEQPSQYGSVALPSRYATQRLKRKTSSLPPVPHPPVPTVSAEVKTIPTPPPVPTVSAEVKTIPTPPPVPTVSAEVKKESSSTTEPSRPEELSIPSVVIAETSSAGQVPEFSLESEPKAPAESLASGQIFSIKLANPEATPIDVMLLYNQYWDACRKVGKDQSTIPEYEEFKSVVITKTAKLKKQFNCEEIVFFVNVQGRDAFVDCQVSKVDSYLKKQPKFRVI